MTTVETQNLSKIIKGNTVIDDVSIIMTSGAIYGIEGKNGSGKTMLFRLLSGLVLPTSGAILYSGKTLHKEIASPPSIGVTIENMGLYSEFTGLRNLQYLASIRKCINTDCILKAIARVGLDPCDKRIVKKYSLGMRQRIVLAQAFMESPDILLLDEPMNGLDESGVETIRKVLMEEADRGALILISSHNRDDIDLLCQVKYSMANGRLELQK
ncbi:MAG: ABC transporter ATP-binding protein [Clostridium sp.]|jgi:ABC-2 type transport system ATP-binding protein|nr:ABC transporter ATP-binding protein [Clostridium sp.]